VAYKMWVLLAIPYIAIRSVEYIHLCDGGNVNIYLWLNSCTNVPWLLVQQLCLLPIN